MYRYLANDNDQSVYILVCCIAPHEQDGQCLRLDFDGLTVLVTPLSGVLYEIGCMRTDSCPYHSGWWYIVYVYSLHRREGRL
jgi:hypothetical protein